MSFEIDKLHNLYSFYLRNYNWLHTLIQNLYHRSVSHQLCLRSWDEFATSGISLRHAPGPWCSWPEVALPSTCCAAKSVTTKTNFSESGSTLRSDVVRPRVGVGAVGVLDPGSAGFAILRRVTLKWRRQFSRVSISVRSSVLRTMSSGSEEICVTLTQNWSLLLARTASKEHVKWKNIEICQSNIWRSETLARAGKHQLKVKSYSRNIDYFFKARTFCFSIYFRLKLLFQAWPVSYFILNLDWYFKLIKFCDLL
jgi:hypothetical protein